MVSPLQKTSLLKCSKKLGWTLKPRSIVNAFAGSGIFPVNASKIGSKASPSDIFSDSNASSNTSPQDSSSHPSSTVLSALEQQMERETILHFEERLAEGYDLVHDPLYNVWSRLKKAVSKSSTTMQCPSSEKENDSDPIPEFSKLSIASTFEKNCRYLNQLRGKSHV